MQLLIDMLQVNANGFDADREFSGDFLVCKTSGDKLHDFSFTLGKVKGLTCLATCGAMKGFDDEPSDLGRHWRSSCPDFEDRTTKIIGRSILEEIAGGPCLQGIENLLIIVVHSEHDHVDVGVSVLDLYGRFDSRHPRQADVHQYDIRATVLDGLQAILGVFPDTEGFDAVHGVDDLSNKFSERWSVLNDGDLDGFSINSWHNGKGKGCLGEESVQRKTSGISGKLMIEAALP